MSMGWQGLSLAASLEQYWEQMGKNRFDEALAELPADMATDTLLARGFNYFARNMEERAAEVWVGALQRPQDLDIVEWEGILHLLKKCSSRGNIDPLLIENLTGFIRNNPNLAVEKRWPALNLLYELAMRNGRWEDAARAAGGLGLIRQWEWTSGPFARFGAEDLYHPFGPEKNLSAASWAEENLIRKPHPLDGPVALGTIDFQNSIYPSGGVAYAFTRFNLEEKTPATLHVLAGDSVRVWLNGRLVIEKNIVELELGREIFVPCELRAGDNWILLKSLKSGVDWSFRMGLLDDQGRSLNLKDALRGDSLEPGAVDPVEAAITKDIFLPPLLKEKLPKFQTQDNSPEDLLFSWAASMKYQEWHLAHKAADLLVERLPEFALAHRLVGQTLRNQGAFRSASKNRLEKQAHEKFLKTLEMNPADAVAADLAARYHISRRTWDEALTTLQDCLAARQEEEWEPTADLLATLGIVQRQKQFVVEALDNLQHAFTMRPGQVRMLPALINLLEESRGQQAAFEVVETAYQHQSSQNLLKLYLNQGMKVGRERQCLPVVERFLSGRPHVRDILLDKAQLEIRLHRWQEAERTLLELIRRNPEDPEPLSRLAQARLLQSETETDPAVAGQLESVAEAALEEALAVHPQDYNLREKLDHLRQERQPGEVEDWYAAFDLQVSDVDMDQLERLPQQRADAVYLIDSYVLEYFPDGTGRSLTHIAVLLKNKEGRQKFAEVTIPNRPGIRLLWAQTWSPDRRQTYEPVSIQDLGGQKAISMFNLEDGSIIDYAYEENFTSNAPPGRISREQSFHFGEKDNPMLISRFVVILPDGVPLHWSVTPEDFAPEVRPIPGGRVLIWQREEVEGFKPERYSPPLPEIVDTVNTSTVRDFLTVQRAVRSTLRGRWEKMDQIRQAALEATEGLTNRGEKIEAVYRYVLDKVENGQGGYTVYDTLATGNGSSFDRAVLAQAMLAQLGIPSDVAYSINSRKWQGLPPLPSMSFLSGTLLYVPAVDSSGSQVPGHLQDRWLNFDSRHRALQDLPATLTQDYAWVLRPGREIFTLPDLSKYDGGWLAFEGQFQLQPDGSARVEGRLNLMGNQRTVIREQMTNPDFRRQVVDYAVSRTLRGIQLEETPVSGEENLEDFLVFGFKGIKPQVLQPGGQRYHLTPILSPADLAELVPDATRQYPLDFQGWVKNMPYLVSYELPGQTDWTFLEIPEDLTIISDFGVYSLIYYLEGRTLHVSRSLLIGAQRIEPEAYDRFAEFCRRVDAAEKRDVIIGPGRFLIQNNE